MNDVIVPIREELDILNLSDDDRNVLEKSLNQTGAGQTTFQSKYFVAGSQLTPYRMAKQCLLELESRHHSYVGIQAKQKRASYEKAIAERALANEPDELKKGLIQCDIDDINYDLKVWERKKRQCEDELRDYLGIFEQVKQLDPVAAEKAFEYDEEEERQYWITRMAKQAAMDMVSYGRIGTGNMDSIAMMNDEDQIMTLATTLQYHERLGQGMQQIHGAVNEGLLENKEHLPKFDIPNFTDKLLSKDLIENVQRTVESKTGPETV